MLYLSTNACKSISKQIETVDPKASKALDAMAVEAEADQRSSMTLDDVEKYIIQITISKSDLKENLESHNFKISDEILDAYERAVSAFDFYQDVQESLDFILEEELDEYL